MTLEAQPAERLAWSGRDGILILDSERGCVLDVNPFLTQLVGVSRDALRGRRIGDLDVFEDRARVEALFEAVRRDGYAHCDDLLLKTRGGVRIPVGFVGNSYLVDETPVIQFNVCERN